MYTNISKKSKRPNIRVICTNKVITRHKLEENIQKSTSKINGSLLCRKIELLFQNEISTGKNGIALVFPSGEELSSSVRFRLGPYMHQWLYYFSSFPPDDKNLTVFQICGRYSSKQSISIKPISAGYAIIGTFNSRSNMDFIAYNICNAIRWAICRVVV